MWKRGSRFSIFVTDRPAFGNKRPAVASSINIALAPIIGGLPHSRPGQHQRIVGSLILCHTI
jgi:hypothetical protein